MNLPFRSALILLLCIPFVSFSQQYRFDRTAGLPLSYDQGQLIYPRDVAIDSDGKIYIVDSDASLIKVFNSSHEFLFEFGQLSSSGPLKLSYPGNVAIAPNGNIYVGDQSDNYETDQHDDVVKVFNREGEFLFKFGGSGSGNGQFFYSINDITIGKDGKVYVVDGHSIQVFEADGRFIFKLNPYCASGIAVTDNGDIYTLCDAIRVYSNTGTLIKTIGSMGTGNGQFMFPRDIAIGSTGNIYVSDSQNSTIQKFSPNGTFIDKFPAPNSQKFTLDVNENIYRIDRNANQIQIFNTNGNFISQFGAYTPTDGKITSPTGVATSSTGNMYVIDGVNDRIQVFNNSGDFVYKFGSTGSADGQFTGITDIKIDKSDNIYITDGGVTPRVQVFTSTGIFTRKIPISYTDRITIHKNGNIYCFNYSEVNGVSIKIYTNSGTLISEFGSKGSNPGQFGSSIGMHIDKNGLLYIADASNNRIQVLDENGHSSGNLVTRVLSTENSITPLG